ncbi:MAG: RNA methyltransferase [Marinilabiliaceae bacterium]|nr:RNA methyltransferase [Marinilabiliaceae bacterium]
MKDNIKLRVEEMGRLSTEDCLNAKHLKLTVVLDNIRSINNVGSIFRTSDAMDVERLFLCGITPLPPSVEMHKTALGAEESVAWKHYDDTLKAVADLKAEGYVVVCIEQVHNSVALQDFDFSPDRSYAVVMGNEVHGVQQHVVDASDYCVEIPQWGMKHSMNVSVTTGMVLWDAARKMKKL